MKKKERKKEFKNFVFEPQPVLYISPGRGGEMAFN